MISNSLNIVSFAFLSFALLVAVIRYAVLNAKYRKTLLELVQSRIDKGIYLDFYEKNILKSKELNSFDVDSQDAFIKFLSNSRDWAFSYIEDTQNVITNVLLKTDQTIKYHKDFMSMEIEPYRTQIDTLVTAIEELKTLIPKEELNK